MCSNGSTIEAISIIYNNINNNSIESKSVEGRWGHCE